MNEISFKVSQADGWVLGKVSLVLGLSGESPLTVKDITTLDQSNLASRALENHALFYSGYKGIPTRRLLIRNLAKKSLTQFRSA